MAVDAKVFVVPEFGGMYCLAAEDGSILWHARNLRQFVATSPGRLYAADMLGRLAILDVSTGVLLGTMPLSGLTTKVVNSQSDRIFLVDDACVVQCLREPQLKSPALHTPPVIETKDSKLVPKQPAATPGEEPLPADEVPAEAAPDAVPEDDNPFAPPAADEGDNPFAPPAGEDPF